VILLIISFIAIESTTSATFIAQGGFVSMMLLGMVLSNLQTNSASEPALITKGS
jgi:hypothetical protein